MSSWFKVLMVVALVLYFKSSQLVATAIVDRFGFLGCLVSLGGLYGLGCWLEKRDSCRVTGPEGRRRSAPRSLMDAERRTRRVRGIGDIEVRSS